MGTFYFSKIMDFLPSRVGGPFRNFFEGKLPPTANVPRHVPCQMPHNTASMAAVGVASASASASTSASTSASRVLSDMPDPWYRAPRNAKDGRLNTQPVRVRIRLGVETMEKMAAGVRALGPSADEYAVQALLQGMVSGTPLRKDGAIIAEYSMPPCDSMLPVPPVRFRVDIACARSLQKRWCGAKKPPGKSQRRVSRVKVEGGGGDAVADAADADADADDVHTPTLTLLVHRTSVPLSASVGCSPIVLAFDLCGEPVVTGAFFVHARQARTGACPKQRRNAPASERLADLECQRSVLQHLLSCRTAHTSVVACGLHLARDEAVVLPVPVSRKRSRNDDADDGGCSVASSVVTPVQAAFDTLLDWGDIPGSPLAYVGDALFCAHLFAAPCS